MTTAISDTLAVELAVVCEDIREELGKKVSLMGVFSGDIIAASFPATIRVAYYFSIRASKTGEHHINVRVTADDAEAPLLQGGSLMIAEGEDANSNVIIPLGFMKFEKPTSFQVEMAAAEGNWVRVIRKRVFEGPVETRMTSASRPPASQSPYAEPETA